MKPLLRPSDTKIGELYFYPVNEETGAEYFHVIVITNDEKEEPALQGTMCVGFFLLLMAKAIKHRAKIFERHVKKSVVCKQIRKPDINRLKKRFTWQP